MVLGAHAYTGALLRLDAMPPVECINAFVSRISTLEIHVARAANRIARVDNNKILNATWPEKLGKKVGNVGNPSVVLVFGTLGFHHAAVLVVTCVITMYSWTATVLVVTCVITMYSWRAAVLVVACVVIMYR